MFHTYRKWLLFAENAPPEKFALVLEKSSFLEFFQLTTWRWSAPEIPYFWNSTHPPQSSISSSLMPTKIHTSPRLLPSGDVCVFIGELSACSPEHEPFMGTGPTNRTTHLMTINDRLLLGYRLIPSFFVWLLSGSILLEWLYLGLAWNLPISPLWRAYFVFHYRMDREFYLVQLVSEYSKVKHFWFALVRNNLKASIYLSMKKNHVLEA